MRSASKAHAREAIGEVHVPRFVIIPIRPRRWARFRRSLRVLLAQQWVRDAAVVGVTLLLVGFLLGAFDHAIKHAGVTGVSHSILNRRLGWPVTLGSGDVRSFPAPLDPFEPATAQAVEVIAAPYERAAAIEVEADRGAGAAAGATVREGRGRGDVHG
jgi:hypothetical protein